MMPSFRTDMENIWVSLFFSPWLLPVCILAPLRGSIPLETRRAWSLNLCHPSLSPAQLG